MVGCKNVLTAYHIKFIIPMFQCISFAKIMDLFFVSTTPINTIISIFVLLNCILTYWCFVMEISMKIYEYMKILNMFFSPPLLHPTNHFLDIEVFKNEFVPPMVFLLPGVLIAIGSKQQCWTFRCSSLLVLQYRCLCCNVQLVSYPDPHPQQRMDYITATWKQGLENLSAKSWPPALESERYNQIASMHNQ